MKGLLHIFKASSYQMQSALQSCRRHFRYAALFSAMLNVLYLAPMLYMMQIFDRVVPTEHGGTLFGLTLVLVFALTILAAMNLIRARLLVRAGARLDRELAGSVLSLSFAGTGATENVSQQVVREFDRLRQGLTGATVLALFDAPWAVVYILVSALIHPLLGLFVGIGAATLLFMTWKNEVGTRDLLGAANERANLAYTRQEFTAASSDTIRALGMERAVISTHLSERIAVVEAQTSANFVLSRWSSASRFVRLALQSVALGVGAYLAINHEISAGAIFAGSFLVGRALGPIDQLNAAWSGLTQALRAFRKLDRLFVDLPATADPTELPAPTGEISVTNLVVLKPQHRGFILNNVSFSIRAGEAVAIVGPSGAGKSTLIRAIAGASNAEGGFIRFDGASRGDWNSQKLAKHIGYMPQHPTLLTGTIKENISRFESAAEVDLREIDSRAVAAAIAAGAHDLILRLDAGYDYEIGLGGRGLSAGQAQKIALARALYGSPRYLLLDEPNAHFDAEGDSQLIATLIAQKAAGVTILVVAHRLSVLPVVDKILVLKEGRLEAFGAREDVLKRISAPQSQQAEAKRAI